MPRLRLLPPVTVAMTPEEAVPILRHLENRNGPVAIDTETTGLDIMRDRVLFWSMATEDARYCLGKDLLEIFYPLFSNPDMRWYFTNAKYDMHMVANMGTPISGEVWDIITMDAMDDDTREHGLKEQAWYAYEARWGEFKDLFLDPHTVAQTLGLDTASFTQFKKKMIGDKLLFVYDERPDMVHEYASCDAFFTYLRAEDLQDQLASTFLPTDMFQGFNTLLDYFEVIEAPLTRQLWEMERNGIAVDTDYVKKIDGPMRDGIRAAEERIKASAGRDFNPKSPDELRDLLFGPKGFGLKPLGYTKGGKSAPKQKTDEKTLQILLGRLTPGSPEAQTLKAILDHRKLIKLHGTYVKNIGKFIWDDGCIHPRINQSAARTSRMSISNPGLQTIPIRNDPYNIRGCFVSDPGTELLDLDFPQIEFRLAAAMAGEEKLMEDIRKGYDIHNANTANMYAEATYEAVCLARKKKDAKEQLTAFDMRMLEYRNGAKTVGLGVLYGEGKRKMASELGISVDAAEELIDTFFSTYPNIKAAIEDFHAYAHETETTHTLLGRIRHLHRINSGEGGIVAAEERQSYNTSVQGSGAELMKLSILRVGNDKDFRSLGGKMRLTVHDELLSTAPTDTAKEAFARKKALMADPYRWGPIQLDLGVPVDPDGHIAKRWSEAH